MRTKQVEIILADIMCFDFSRWSEVVNSDVGKEKWKEDGICIASPQQDE